MKRADQLLVERGLAASRSQAQGLILAGQVRSGTRRVAKAGERLAPDAPLTVTEPLPFVSRGGSKLAHALETFGIAVEGAVAIDIGASTGGFTDCLLKRGASKVYAVDVGYGQLDWRLRQHPRVVVIEKTNVRYWKGEEITEPIDCVTIDVSFISLIKVLPPLQKLLECHGGPVVTLIALVKPQFEVGKGEVGKGGVVRDVAARERVVTTIETWLREEGWCPLGVTPSPVRGAKGNQEYLIAARKTVPFGRNKVIA